jgi:hypothetical protein
MYMAEFGAIYSKKSKTFLGAAMTKAEAEADCYRRLAALRPAFLQAIKDLDDATLRSAHSYGLWVIQDQSAVHDALMALEKVSSSQASCAWQNEVLVESGRFDKGGPYGYPMFKETKRRS